MKPFVQRVFFFIILISVDQTTAKVIHKIIDFVPVLLDKKTFEEGYQSHLKLRTSAQSHIDKANKEDRETEAQGILALQNGFLVWPDDTVRCYGTLLEDFLIVVCWFAEDQKAGAFYFEGYTEEEAKNVVRSFAFDWKKVSPDKAVKGNAGAVFLPN